MDSLVTLGAVVVVIWLVLWVVSIVPTSEPWGTVLRIVVGLLLIVWVVRKFGVLSLP